MRLYQKKKKKSYRSLYQNRGELERVLWLDLQGTLRGEHQYVEFPNSESTRKQPA